MKKPEIDIVDARPEDAPLIADAVLTAVGDEIARGLAGEDHTVADVRAMFTRLATRPDSQYSYLNSRIAIDANGSPMGVCVSYDGARLIELRRAFFSEARDTLGWQLTDAEIDALPGETSPDEYYLDSLMTLPAYRGQGVARALIRDAHSRAIATGKPLGLLCDLDNHRARRLYDSLGFTSCGQRPFAGHRMHHLRLPR